MAVNGELRNGLECRRQPANLDKIVLSCLRQGVGVYTSGGDRGCYRCLVRAIRAWYHLGAVQAWLSHGLHVLGIAAGKLNSKPGTADDRGIYGVHYF